jgi:hypothetical protein
VTDILSAVTAEVELLRRSREEIATLVQRGRARPSWQPECPLLGHDEDLLRRLEECVQRTEAEHRRLTVHRRDLLCDARSRSPFVCPALLRARIEYVDRLLHFARNRNVYGFLKVYGRCPEGRPLDDELGKWVQRLGCRWREVTEFLEYAALAGRSGRQKLEQGHDASIAREVDALLTAQNLALLDAVAQARQIVTDVRAVREREAAAREAVGRIWWGTHRVSHFAHRAPVPLDEDDRALALTWARDHGTDRYWIGAMESARGAELVALEVYRELYGEAEDLSILQQGSPDDSRWRTADIATAERSIDVKNARRSFSSPRSYSEHVVKRFKSDRCSQDVIVAGFLSPYVADGSYATGEEVIWLGETTLGTIERLRREFETDYLKIELSGKWSTLLPPWMFEYPPECYADRDAALDFVRSQGFLLPRFGCTPGILVLAGRIAPTAPEDTVSKEAVLLRRRLNADVPLGHPALFLHILDRFCRCLHGGNPFPAAALRELLYPDGSSRNDCTTDATTPLAVFDPLGTVRELLDVLECVAERCPAYAATFKSFKLVGARVLQGRDSRGEWQTIFAYCGGWRKLRSGQRVKCGQSPLFLGQNDPCNSCTCRKLVCQTCGYCGGSCPCCSPRQVEWPWSRTTSWVLRSDRHARASRSAQRA